MKSCSKVVRFGRLACTPLIDSETGLISQLGFELVPVLEIRLLIVEMDSSIMMLMRLSSSLESSDLRERCQRD